MMLGFLSYILTMRLDVFIMYGIGVEIMIRIILFVNIESVIRTRYNMRLCHSVFKRWCITCCTLTDSCNGRIHRRWSDNPESLEFVFVERADRLTAEKAAGILQTERHAASSKQTMWSRLVLSGIFTKAISL